MPLNLFYTTVQKSQKWPKTQIKGGSCLKQAFFSETRTEIAILKLEELQGRRTGWAGSGSFIAIDRDRQWLDINVVQKA